MTRKQAKQQKGTAKSLRKRAEALLRAKPSEVPTMPTADMQALVHELNVHQVELEIQNEELREAQFELVQSRDRYSNLYDFAPVGYITLTKDGRVLEANLTAATMLGVERQTFLKENFAKFIASQWQDDFYLHRQAVFSSTTKQVCELDMHKADGTGLAVRLESIAQTIDDEWQCRTVLIDVTDVRQAQEQIQESEERMRLAAEATGFGSYDFEPHSLQVTWSSQLCVIYGFPDTTRPTGELFMNLVHPDDRARVAGHTQQACDPAGPGQHDLQYRIVHPNGEIRWIQDTGRTIFAEQDGIQRPVRVVGTVVDITEQKRVDEQLHQLNITLEERVAEQTREIWLLAEAVSSLGEGVLITEDDTDWPSPRIKFVNEAMCLITGYSADELVGQTPRILQGKDTNRETLDRIKTELNSGRSFTAELVNYRKDGTPYDAELFITPLFDEAGRRTNFVSIYRDITKRKAAERALQASEQRLRLALEAGGMGTWERESGTDLLIWDEAQFEIFGIDTEAKLTGERFLQLVHPADRPRVIQVNEDCLLHGKKYSIEFRIVRPDGQIRWIAGKGMIVRDKQNRPSRMIGVNFDITKAKDASAALRNSEERLRMTLDTISEGILTTDSKGIILDINPATERIFGYPGKEVIGRNLSMFVLERDESLYRNRPKEKNFRKEREGKDVHDVQEKVGLKKDGARIPIEVSYSYATGTHLYIYLLRDISERRGLESEILRVSEEEKRELAHDLHDSICQELGGLAYMASTVADNLHSESHSHAQQAKRVSEKIVQAMNSVRQLSHSLDPLMEGPESLSRALRLLASTTKEIFKLDCRFSGFGEVHLRDTNTAINLYRITQEAVHNSFRHGQATRVSLSLKEEKGRILLKILDNGSGLPTGEPSNTGSGLRIMKYRMAALGGWIKIGNRRKGGVEVACSVPNQESNGKSKIR